MLRYGAELVCDVLLEADPYVATRLPPHSQDQLRGASVMRAFGAVFLVMGLMLPAFVLMYLITTEKHAGLLGALRTYTFGGDGGGGGCVVVA